MCGFFVTPACAVCDDSPEKNVVIWRDWTTSSFPPAKEGTGETLFSIVDTPRDAGSQRTIESSPADRPRRPLEASSADRASVRRVSTFTSPPLHSGHASQRGRVPLAQVRAEDHQGRGVPPLLLPMHRAQLPRAQARRGRPQGSRFHRVRGYPQPRAPHGLQPR